MVELTVEQWYKTGQGKFFIDCAFKEAGLEEIPGVPLEEGTYSNEEIRSKFEDRLALLEFLSKLSKKNSEFTRRSLAKFALDIMFPEKIEKV